MNCMISASTLNSNVICNFQISNYLSTGNGECKHFDEVGFIVRMCAFIPRKNMDIYC